jgi:hypothetical protein
MKNKKVILEPELEAVAGELSVFDRLMLAEKLERWPRQLRVSAKVLSKQPWQRRSIPRLSTRRLQWN